jgi:hypothetical protein
VRTQWLPGSFNPEKLPATIERMKTQKRIRVQKIESQRNVIGARLETLVPRVIDRRRKGK